MNGVPRILLAGIDGHGHLGDEAVTAALVLGLRERHPDVRLCASAWDEERVRRWLEVPAVPCQDWARLAQAVADADLLVVGCGRELSERGGFEPHGILADDARGLAHTAGLALLASALGRPFVLASVAAGPFHDPAAEAAAGCLAARAARLLAADEPSARQLLELGAEPARLETGADLAYSLRPCSAERTAEILKAARLPRRAGGLVAVVPPEEPDGQAWARALAVAGAELSSATEAAVAVLPAQLESAHAGVEALRGHLPPERVHALPVGLWPEEAAGVLGQCELVISLRRHGAILAAVGGAAALALGPTACAEGAGVPPELGMPPEAPRELAACLRWGWEHRAALRQRARAAAERLAARANHCLDRLATDVGALASPPLPHGLERLLAPALAGALARARTASWEREQLRRDAEARLAAHHRDLVGQIEDRDRLVRCLQAELHAKVGERDRTIRELQAQLAAATGGAPAGDWN